MSYRNWNDILHLLEVKNVYTDAEWDEAKIKAIEATVIAIIDKLKYRDGEL